jgi:1,4-dihydroxy-2-naphthoate octaprenyltransferase
MSAIADRLHAWLALSRPPFHSVGILPFVLGSALAWRQQDGVLRWDVFLWGTLGVVLVMLATYYAGEYWDYAEDTLSARTSPSRFAGGSQVVQRGLLPHRAPLLASLASLLFTTGVMLLLRLGYHTGPWTIPFGMLGMAGGFFYSARPVRWVSTGWGEVWIAFCYGWLPVAVGYYLQTAKIVPLIHWLAIPIGLTIFNVILLNEFLDYAADLAAGKRNLTVRLGRQRAARLYAITSLASWAAMLLSLDHGVPRRGLWFWLPVLSLSAALVVLVMRSHWQDRSRLEGLCAVNLLVNLGTTAVYIAAFVR